MIYLMNSEYYFNKQNTKINNLDSDITGNIVTEVINLAIYTAKTSITVDQETI